MTDYEYYVLTLQRVLELFYLRYSATTEGILQVVTSCDATFLLVIFTSLLML